MSDPIFDNTYIKLPSHFYEVTKGASFHNPELVHINSELARNLKIPILNFNEKELAEFFSGQKYFPGSEPIALAYAGHQFGHFVPQLGDGRALLLGEIIALDGKRYDIQLKGAGRTVFSRGGDGRSSLGPVFREYLVSEAMHYLGIPSSRALACVATGETVLREEKLPGGVFTRVASSHIRVGTFEYFYYKKSIEDLKLLADYTIKRHYPEALGCDDPYFSFLKHIAHKKLKLVSLWMSYGFIHGVMNTDNTSIAGETIDFGPCAFMDKFSFTKVFSSIDRYGRYAYNNQGNMALWNLANLAHCVRPLVKSDRAIDELFEELPSYFHQQWLSLMREKLGLEENTAGSEDLIHLWLNFLEKNELDFTTSFKNLEQYFNKDVEKKELPFRKVKGFDDFYEKWMGKVNSRDNSLKMMQKRNPVYIPRNHLVEKAIKLGYEGDYSLFKRLNEVWKNPYQHQDNADDLIKPPLEHEIVRKTFCGT